MFFIICLPFWVRFREMSTLYTHGYDWIHLVFLRRPLLLLCFIRGYIQYNSFVCSALFEISVSRLGINFIRPGSIVFGNAFKPIFTDWSNIIIGVFKIPFKMIGCVDIMCVCPSLSSKAHPRIDATLKKSRSKHERVENSVASMVALVMSVAPKDA